MKIVIFSMGPGETSQAYAVAKKFQSKGHLIEFVIGKETNKGFISKSGINWRLIPSSSRGSYEQLSKFINSCNPDLVLLCNSKSYGRTDFVDKSPWPHIPTYTLDSNWLFNDRYSDFKYVKWAEKYFINIPQLVFNDGLKQNGGNFEIGQEMMKKIHVVGLIPSYSKLNNDSIIAYKESNHLKNKKIVFCYVSGQGAGSRLWVLNNLLNATKPLTHQDPSIKILVSGFVEDQSQLPHTWCQYLGSDLSIEEFYQALSCADLVFQHQGLATLTQAICACVPVITNVADYQEEAIPQLHTYELSPFERNGVCEMLRSDTEIGKITQAVKTMLYDDGVRDVMIEKQKQIFNNGEEEVYNAICQLISKPQ